MTSDFEARLAKGARLAIPFIAAFNKESRSHQISKFGIENTELQNIHRHIRTASDATSQLIRHLPDSALVRLGSGTSDLTVLVEFKVHDTPVRTERMLTLIRTEHDRLNQGNPPIKDGQDIFGIEKASLEACQLLAKIGGKVIVVGWQTYRTIDSDVLRAQFAENIVVCQEHTPDPSRRVTGSGTPMANLHFDSFVPIQDFFEREFAIPREVIKVVERSILDNQLPG